MMPSLERCRSANQCFWTWCQITNALTESHQSRYVGISEVIRPGLAFSSDENRPMRSLSWIGRDERTYQLRAGETWSFVEAPRWGCGAPLRMGRCELVVMGTAEAVPYRPAIP